MRWRMWRSAAVSLGVASACAQAFADEQPSVTPYRPSVSTPAALSAPGWLEIEAGGVSSRAAARRVASRRDSLGYTFKLAFTEDWGVRFGGDARARQTDKTGGRVRGAGATSVVLKRRMAIDKALAFGVEAGVTLPMGSKASAVRSRTSRSTQSTAPISAATMPISTFSPRDSALAIRAWLAYRHSGR